MPLLAEKSRLGQKVVVRRTRRRRNNLSRGLRWRNRKRSRRTSYGRVLYNYYRTYDPSTGRYLESDPIGIDGGLNTYGYALQDPLTQTDPFGLSPFKIIKLCAEGYKVVKEIGFREAVRALRRGEDVLAPSVKEARSAANSASNANRPIRDRAHQEGYMPHYHPNPRTGGHIFYSMAAALTFSHYVPEECNDDCAVDEAASVLDFFNPLSAPQDLIDIYELLKEY